MVVSNQCFIMTPYSFFYLMLIAEYAYLILTQIIIMYSLQLGQSSASKNPLS